MSNINISNILYAKTEITVHKVHLFSPRRKTTIEFVYVHTCERKLMKKKDATLLIEHTNSTQLLSLKCWNSDILCLSNDFDFNIVVSNVSVFCFPIETSKFQRPFRLHNIVTLYNFEADGLSFNQNYNDYVFDLVKI